MQVVGFVMMTTHWGPYIFDQVGPQEGGLELSGSGFARNAHVGVKLTPKRGHPSHRKCLLPHVEHGLGQPKEPRGETEEGHCSQPATSPSSAPNGQCFPWY